MSEYQYYEFQTVDRRLTEREMQQLRASSSRALITPTSFSSEYHFGDFRGNPNAWMEKYFDGFLYCANWGTRELQLALPAKALESDTARRYLPCETASAREKSGKLILRFRFEEEGADWIRSEERLSSLLPILGELALGDYRVLYLGWLMCVQNRELGPAEPEPPVPPNLGNLSAAQECFAEFFNLDSDLLAVAAKNSLCRSSESVDRNELLSWIRSLPTAEKDEILVRLMACEETNVGMELKARFHRLQKTNHAASATKARTAGELLDGANAHLEEREQEQQRKAAIEEEKGKREAAIARDKYLGSLKGRTEEIWSTVGVLVATRQPKSYDLAVQRLVDLRDVAIRESHGADFTNRLESFCGEHSAKRSLIDRLAHAGLSPERRIWETV